MSHTLQTSPGRAAREPAGGRRTAVSPRDVLRRIVHFLTSMRVALVLLIILTLLTLAGTMLAQAPSTVKGDPQAYASWVESVRPKYGGWTPVFDKLQLLTVFSSIWFKGAMVLLTASLLACSVRRAPRLWRQAARPPMVMKDAFFERVPHRATFASEGDPEGTVAKVRATFGRQHFHTAAKSDGDAVHVCADRFRWAPMGRVVGHVGLIVILSAAFITTTQGFRNDQFTVPVGSTVPVGNGTDIAVKAKAFSDTYYPNGQPRDFRSDLVLYENGRQVRTGAIRVNHPMHYRGITFYQSFFGAVAAIQVKGTNGKVLYDEGVPLPWQSKDGKDRIGRFTLPKEDLTVFVVGPASGEVDPRIAAGQVQLEVYRGDTETPVAIRRVSEGKTAKLAGLDFKFAREGQFTGLIVARDPGSLLVWIGSTLLVLGISAAFFFPHRRIRAVIRRGTGGTETRVGGTAGRRDPDFEAQFKRVVDDMKLALGRAGAT